MMCCNVEDGCLNDVTNFVIGIDGRKRHFCADCYVKVAAEMNRRFKEEPKWREAAARAFKLNAAAGNYLRFN